MLKFHKYVYKDVQIRKQESMEVIFSFEKILLLNWPTTKKEKKKNYKIFIKQYLNFDLSIKTANSTSSQLTLAIFIKEKNEKNEKKGKKNKKKYWLEFQFKWKL